MSNTITIHTVEMPIDFFVSTLSDKAKNKALLRWEIVQQSTNCTNNAEIARRVKNTGNFEYVGVEHIERELYRVKKEWADNYAPVKIDAVGDEQTLDFEAKLKRLYEKSYMGFFCWGEFLQYLDKI